CQGSNTSTGAPDKKWNFRPERVLTAACLRLDPRLLDVHAVAATPASPFAPRNDRATQASPSSVAQERWVTQASPLQNPPPLDVKTEDDSSYDPFAPNA